MGATIKQIISLKKVKNETTKEEYKNEPVKIEVKKEGVHFDLDHRNRIEWSLDNLDDFRKKLESRIKATII